MRVEGQIKLIGEGRVRGPFTKRSVIEIGDHVVHNLRVHTRIASYMNVDTDVAIGYQTIFIWKQSLAIATTDGRVHKVGAFRMVTIFILALILMFMAFGAAAATHLTLVWLFVLLFAGVAVQALLGLRTALAFAPYHGKASTQQSVIGT